MDLHHLMCRACGHWAQQWEDNKIKAESCLCHCHDTFKFVVLGRPWKTPVPHG